MRNILEQIRFAKDERPIWRKILITACVLLLGLGMGTFSKYLDYHQARAPFLLGIIDERLDIHNFLGGFAPWILIAVCISIYSKTAVRSAMNVFVFFAGMLSGYYLYCNYVCGFFPRSYVMIWCWFTAISPLLAFICWYAKGKGKVALIISTGIIAILIRLAVYFGVFYISIRSGLDIIVLLIGIIVLRRPLKEMVVMLGAGTVLAMLFCTIIPFYLW